MAVAIGGGSDDNLENYAKWLTEFNQIKFIEEAESGDSNANGDGDNSENSGYQKQIYQSVNRLEKFVRKFNYTGDGDVDVDTDEDLYEEEHPYPSKTEEEKCHMDFLKLMNLSALSFLHEHLNNKSESSKYLLQFREFLQKCVEEDEVSREHEEGFNYVVNFIGNSESSPSTTTKSFEDLSPKARACVYGIKQQFFNVFDLFPRHHIKILQNAVELEPDFYLWHLVLYKNLRNDRRLGRYRSLGEDKRPSKEERRAIITASQLKPNHPGCLVREILCLAEVLKASEDFSRETIEIRGVEFKTKDELIQFITEQAQRVNDLAPTSNYCNSTVASIFTKLLKHPHTDLDMSEGLLFRCLDRNPKSGSICFRLGELYLYKRNYDEAQLYFEKGVELSKNRSNVAYWSCLIQVLMRDPLKNQERLEEIFKEILENPDIKNDTMRKPINKLKFFQAQYLLTIPSKREEAINILCQLCEESEDLLKFDTDRFQHFRFGWIHPSLKLEIVKEMIVVERAKRENIPQAERREVLTKIMNKINQAINRNRGSQRPSGGGRGVGRWPNYANYAPRGNRHDTNSGVDSKSWRD